MDLSFLMDIVREYGYVSMFIFNWLLLFGLPIPNEVAAAFSGVLTEISYFTPIKAFISAYLGLITSNTFAYFIGRFFGKKLLDRLYRTKLKKPIMNFSDFLEKHGEIAISFSFFLPGIRWAMPYVVGANKYPFIKYMLYAYSAGFVWMMVYFNLGRTFPYAYASVLDHLQGFLIFVSAAVIFALLSRYLYKERKARK